MGANRTWKADAASGAWGTAGNWVENAAPGSADDVFFTTWSGGTAVSHTTYPAFWNMTYSGGQDFSLTSGGATFGMYGTNVSVTGGSGNITFAASTIVFQIFSASAILIRNDSSGLLTLPRVVSYGNATALIRDVHFTGGNITIEFLAFRNSAGSYMADANLVKSGAGTLTLKGPQSGYTDIGGKTTINGGTVAIGGENWIGKNPAAFAADHLKLDGGTLRTTNSFAINDSNRGITLGSGGGTFSVDSGTTLTVSNLIAGSGSLTKTGVGTLTLSATNTYSGATAVGGGTLRVSGSLAADSAVTVNSNATLAGTGTVHGAVTAENGGIVAPGGSAGALNVGSLALNASSVCSFELAETNASDKIVIAGDLTLDGVLNVTRLTGFTNGTYVLMTYGGNLTDNGLELGDMPFGKLYSLQAGAGEVRLVVSLNSDVPEMAVLGTNGAEIACGEPAPTAAAGTDFGYRSFGDPLTHTFTITNSGLAELFLTNSPAVAVLGDHAADFTVTRQPSPTNIPAGQAVTFDLKFEPLGAGTCVATVSIGSTDLGHHPYTFAVQGSGPFPVMRVLGVDGSDVTNGMTSVSAAAGTDFGATTIVAPIERTFTITNSGTYALELTNATPVTVTGAHAADFSVISQPSASVAAGGSATFTARFLPQGAGTRTATVSIGNTDPQRDPYTFALQGALDGPAQPVTLTDNGATFTLANGIVSAVITKSNGECTDLRLAGGANLLANGGLIYYDAFGSKDGGASENVAFDGASYRVVTNTPSRVEIALTDSDLIGFKVQLHYTLRAGDSGLCVHAIWRHRPGNPQASLTQTLMKVRCDGNVFTRAYASPGKTGQMIAPALLNTTVSPMIMDATHRLPMVSSYTNETGYTEDHYPVYTKYDWANAIEAHLVHGVSSDRIGLWMVMGSVEYYNGGPTKANQTVHGTDTTPTLLWIPHGQHFGSAPIVMAADQVWDKIMGPFFIYINSGANAAQLWDDAQNKAAAEKDAWPYAWMNETLYPLARGTVAGRLRIPGESANHALVVLAQPGSYWQQQSEGYQFWTRASEDGSFVIPKVRPGNYTLFARVPGMVGEFRLDDLTVSPGATHDLGLLEWQPPRRERRLWRIGTPDLSAGEFRFGDRMRQFGLWWRYLEEQGTNDLVYRVGSSSAADWYYAQSVVAMDDGTYFSPVWKIEFTLTDLPPAPVVLTLGMAGSVGGTLFTSVNGTSLPDVSLTNDASIYRSATQSGMFRQVEWSFDPAWLHPGTNVIAFTVSKNASWTGAKPVQPVRGLMYDFVQLEAGGDALQFSILSIEQPGMNEVALRWQSVTNASYDVFYRSNLLEGSWQLLDGGIQGQDSPCSVTSAVPAGQQYFFRINARRN